MSTTKKSKAGGDTYLDLVRAFPLRAIRTEDEAAEAGGVLTKLLMSKADDARDAGERQYIDALGDLILRYQETAPARLPKLPPVELLKHLMAEQDMTVSDLGKIIGSQPAASMVLAGDRELSKAHVRKLAAHFGLSPGAFI